MKTHRKFLAMLLALVLCFTALPISAFAVTPPTYKSWDGTSDVSWYNDTDTEFHLTTAEQLAGLAEIVNGGNTLAGKTIYLDADLDLLDRRRGQRDMACSVCFPTELWCKT